MSDCPDEFALMAVAAGDPGHEVHIEACDACRAAVAMLAAMATDDGGADADAPRRLVDRYLIGEPLGAGGLGLVVAAHDTHLGIEVAIKWLRPDRPRSEDRLAEEVRLARRIRHPNVCAVFDLGRDGSRAFITMERIDGTALPDWVEARRPTRTERRALMLAIIDGVAAAHRCDVVHRDLKPDNVMVDADGHARVMDFGLATEALGHDAGRVGTPRWWAPEQHAGRPATYRTDVFALGRIADWLLPDATRATRRWIRRCLADDPTDRFADAGALGRHVRRAPIRRSMWTGAVLAMVCALGFVGRQAMSPDEAPRALRSGIEAIARNQMASGIRELRTALRDAPDQAVAHLWLGYAHSWLGQTARARDALDEALLRSEQLSEDERLFALALNARVQHDIPRARVLLDRVLAIAPDHPQGLFTRADLDYHVGRFAEAAARFDVLVRTRPHHNRAWDHLVWARMVIDGADAGERVTRRWLAAAPGPVAREAHAAFLVAVGRPAHAAIDAARRGRRRDADPPTFAAIVHLEAGRPSDALASLREYREAVDPERSSYADAIRRLGWVHLANESFEAAIRSYAAGRAATTRWRPESAAGKPAFATTLAAELAWGLAVMGGPAPVPSAVELAADPAVHADRFAAGYVVLACLMRNARACLRTTAEIPWPAVQTIRQAHALLIDGAPEAAADVLRRAAGETTPHGAIELLLAAAHIERRHGAPDRAAVDLARAATYRFASPQSILARALYRRSASGPDAPTLESP